MKSPMYGNRDEAPPIVDIPTIKAWMKIPESTTDQDLILNIISKSVSQEFENYIDAPIVSRTFIEIHDGDGADSIVPVNKPVRLIKHIHIDYSGKFEGLDTEAAKLNSSIRLPDDQYYLRDSNCVVILSRDIANYDGLDYDTFQGTGTIRVEYEAGFGDTAVSLPGDLLMASLMRIEQMYMMRENRAYNVTSKSKADSKLDFKLGMPAEVTDVLDRYVDPSFPKNNKSIKKVYVL